MKEIDNCAMLRAAANNMQMGYLDHLANGGKKDPAQEQWIDALSEGVEALERLEKQKWISVKERLPNPGVNVLIYAKGLENENDGVITVSHYTHNKYGFSIKGWVAPWQYFERYYRITHWIELPKPPKEERK